MSKIHYRKLLCSLESAQLPHDDVNEPTDYRKLPRLLDSHRDISRPTDSTSRSVDSLGLTTSTTGLPDIKTFMEDLQGAGSTESGLCDWSRNVPVTRSTEDTLAIATNTLLTDSTNSDDTAGLPEEDILDGTEMFQMDPFQEPWGLSKLFQSEVDDVLPYITSMSGSDETEGPQGRRKIEQVSRKLNISTDPCRWSISDVHKWLQYTLYQYNGPTSLIREDDWPFNGAQLCQLSSHDINDRLPRDGGIIVAELEQWKQLSSQLSSSYPHNVHVSPYMCHYTTSFNLLPPAGPDMNYTLLESNTPNTASLLSLEPSLSSIHLHSSSNNDNNNNNNTHISNYNNYLLSHTSAQRRLMVQTPEPLLSTRCPTSSVWDTGLTTAVAGLSCDSVNPAAYIKTEVLTHNNASSPTDDMSPTATNWLYKPTDTVNKRSMTNCKWTSASTLTSHNMSDFRPTSRGRGGNKRTICLWQFLRELLLNPQPHENWIRWIDRNRGIFKIEDSVRVAKLWGERKNRPQMNYDKLSRSIRQYYKKGIIQKTTNSKRLVYQFCPAYMQ